MCVCVCVCVCVVCVCVCLCVMCCYIHAHSAMMVGKESSFEWLDCHMNAMVALRQVRVFLIFKNWCALLLHLP